MIIRYRKTKKRYHFHVETCEDLSGTLGIDAVDGSYVFRMSHTEGNRFLNWTEVTYGAELIRIRTPKPNTILEGNCLEVLRTLPSNYAHCVVTSPPYWGLRDYGVDGQLGLEETPSEYVQSMVRVFKEVHRVLRDDGTLWLNLGDSYATGGGDTRVGFNARYHGQDPEAETKQNTHTQITGHKTGLPLKSLMGVPWRVALALQEEGWILRSDIIWAKPAPLPESIRDRPTKSHEHLFLFAQSQKYYYDQEAVKEKQVKGSAGSRYDKGKTGARDGGDRTQEGYRDSTKRNIRDVWTISSQKFPEAHFAVMPPKLVEPCVKAGSPEDGIVLDPFMGAGTVGLVAKRLGRNYLGIELNPEYAEMARKRIRKELIPLKSKLRRRRKK